jgi:23S rRNA (uridine2479-2'-O)-methyltransferase
MKANATTTSAESEAYQHLLGLQQNRRLRNKSREFLVEGVRSINEALRCRWTINALVYAREKRLSDWAQGILDRTEARTHLELADHLVRKLSQKEETSELLAVVAMPEDDLARIPVGDELLAVVFDRPASPGNLGTLISSCDALGADGLIITGHAADAYDPETVRATTGSCFCVPVVRLPSQHELLPWFEGLKQRLAGFQIVGTSAKAQVPIAEHDFTAPTVLLVGNENHGLSVAYRALCDAMVTIPMEGSATSLNVACATSILLYEVARQRRQRARR